MLWCVWRCITGNNIFTSIRCIQLSVQLESMPHEGFEVKLLLVNRFRKKIVRMQLALRADLICVWHELSQCRIASFLQRCR